MMGLYLNAKMKPLTAPPKWKGKPMHMLRLRTIMLNDADFRALPAQAERDKE